jgi:hypothetical protein
MRIYEIKSFTSDTIYKVVQNDNGHWYCNCAFQFNHPNEVCDHIRKSRHQRLKNHGRAAIKKKKEAEFIKLKKKDIRAKMKLKIDLRKLKKSTKI